MTPPLTPQKQGALWRAYKKHQSANYVARTCKVSPHTAQKYIEKLHFRERLAELQKKANALVDQDQVESFADDLKVISNIKTRIGELLLDALEKGEIKIGTLNFADYERFTRIERLLRGEPEATMKINFKVEPEYVYDDEREEPEGNGGDVDE